jgi:AcrR family transcriptional regulator
LREAMRLFGERGYEATTVATIEDAAGLSPGAGGLYRHFRSKRDLLTAGITQQVRSVANLLAFVDQSQLATAPEREALIELARAGLRRLDANRDLNRILHRGDLTAFPELLELVRDQDFQQVLRSVTAWMESRADAATLGSRDWPAITAVLVGAVVQYWLARDALGRHPDSIDEERFLAAWAEVALAQLR